MIVKNEMKVLPRCFDSVSAYIDHWVICDTGSTDGTQEFITNYFREKKIPGKLHQYEWKNFGYNRTLAVRAAKKTADYLLLMDADFIFCLKDPNFKKKHLDKTSYLIKYEGALDYRQTLFVSGKKSWKYVGVTHEYITCDSPNLSSGPLDAFTFDHLADGGNRSDKFERDIRLLTQGLIDEPNNSRYMFYLARSHKDLGHWNEAIKYYHLRAKAGGWVEELYISLFDMGVCMMKRGDPYDKFKGVLLKAYQTRSTRLEALHALVSYCRLHELYEDGYNHGLPALNNKYPTEDNLFIDKEVHEWKFFYEVAQCAYYMDKPLESVKIYKKLIEKGKLPENKKSDIELFKEKYEIQLRNIIKPKLIQIVEVTVILNVYKRINIFETQLQAVINQTIKPKEIWVCIFASPYEKDFLAILTKYPQVKVIRSDINFKFYGRFQLALQATTPYVCFYDDDRFPRENNLKFYLELVQKKEFEKAILGQWGWMLHEPEYKDDEIIAEWEYHPHYQNSWWISSNSTRAGRAFKVDYLCGHWFTHRDTLFSIFREVDIDFSTGEDMRLSILAYKHHGIESYCCYPLSGSELIEHNEGNVQGSTDVNNLKVRSRMIKDYLYDDYQLVITRSKTVINLYRTKKNICFFCPDYTSIGGSELTIKHLYNTIVSIFPDSNIKITTNGEEMLYFKPDIVITQQLSIKYALENASGYGYDVYILLHGPGQFRNYHPRCKLLIYNSDSLMESEKSYVDESIKRMVLHPTIDSSLTESLERDSKLLKGSYITFIGSSSYNIIKGSDVFVSLAYLVPEKDFLHVSKYQPINYEKDKYMGMKIEPVQPSYTGLPSNMEIVEQTNKISEVYEKTKILIVPSVVESFGRVAVEAAINRIPVIASDLPGLRDATFNLAYYIKDYRNAEKFKEAISEVESNYQKYQKQTEEIMKLYNQKQEMSISTLKDFIMTEQSNENDFYHEYTQGDPSIGHISFSHDIFARKRTGIVIPIYNRPEYLTLTLKSLSESNLNDTIVIMIDDHSNEETIDIILEYEIGDVPIIKIFKC